MQLIWIDWLLVGLFFALALGIGLWVSRRAGQNPSEFFLSGRSMPWWLLGMSMVATTFSTDTPNLVTNIVRQDGVAGNWVWWAFLITGMLTVFIYARLWRRLGLVTDLEFYEIRYSGQMAAFLRGFRAIYLGLLLNVLIMGAVTLAAIKIGAVMLGWSPWQTVLVASVVTAVFSAAGGLRGVILTDFFLFIVTMGGSITAAVIALRQPEVAGLTGLLNHENLVGKLSLLPSLSEPELFLTVLVIPLAVQWWASWYPGAEPGGGGYVVQRMLSAKNEAHAMGATLFFQIAHYALRPWPWILVALASLIIFPDLESIQVAFPHVDERTIGHDLAYPAMLTLLPAGVLGLVIASLAAAYMSTISTHLNWGASYLVNDVWKRFINPAASAREMVFAGRICTGALMILGAGVALLLENALQAFHLLLLIGTGTGLLFLLRWFWWRVTAASEIASMISASVVGLSVTLYNIHAPEGWWTPPNWGNLLITALATTIVWITVAYLGPQTDEQTLRAFYRRVQPGGRGWRAVVQRAHADGEILETGGDWAVPFAILCTVAGSLAVYSALFATGYWIYGQPIWASLLTLLSIALGVFLFKGWKRVAHNTPAASVEEEISSR
jgi:solute:Na+ symporter, SSS family